MRSYVLASCSEQREAMWIPLQSAIKYIALVGNQVRSSSRAYNGIHPRISDAEMSVRREWHSIGQAEPNLSLADLIELVCQRRSIWPLFSELKPLYRRGDVDNGKGKGKGKGKGRTLQDRMRYARESGETVLIAEIFRPDNSQDWRRISR